MLTAGMVEIVRCSGTGVNNCEFRWRRGHTCLVVDTYGEYLPERGFPRVGGFLIDNCSKAFDESH
jgi:hypothetical protein